MLIIIWSLLQAALAFFKTRRQLAAEPPEMGEVIALPVVGGLHHRYTRRAA